MLGYLSAEDARKKLIIGETVSESDCPSVGILESLLTDIEIYMDGWLRSRLAPTVYAEVVRANDRAIALTNQYPILRIIDAVPIERQGINMAVGQAPNTLVLWEGDARVISLLYPLVQVKLTYEAGLDPLPPIFGSVAFQILKRILETTGTSGDLSFLEEPVQDIESIALPGGLSKKFRGGSNGGTAKPESMLDRLMKPLTQYQRKLVF